MLNLVEILKNVPLGTELYCTIFGKVWLISIDSKASYPIVIGKDKKSIIVHLTKEGKWNDSYPGECILFPSENNRDWSTFKVQPQFNPFQKVLVRDSKNDMWLPDFFGFYMSDNCYFPFQCVGGCYRYCIPYCEELLGTNKDYKL